MAASGKRSRRSSSSSEEEDEDRLARFREAAWDPALQNWGNVKKSKLTSAESCIRQGQQPTTTIINSKRTTGHLCSLNGEKVSGNELDTTPEFRAHVAKKLGAILDSSITILENLQGPTQKNTTASGTEDDGFRLFSSSVPGDDGKPESLPSGRRRQQQHCSSSETDSDQEWQRCQEAAVSAAEILRHSGFPTAALQDSEPRLKKKKRKKKKAEGEDGSEQEMVETVLQRPMEKLPDLSGSCKRAENSKAEHTNRKEKKMKAKAATE